MIVYTLHISHRHGYNLSVHETDVAANIAVEAYCKQEWSGEVGQDVPMPTEPGDLVSRYFEAAEEEYFEIEQHEILDDDASRQLYTLDTSAT